MITKTKIYSTMTFADVYEEVGDFLEDYTTAGIPTTISTTNATTLYYLLYAKYANRPILNLDLNQWKYKLLSVIFTAGPAWEKRLFVQEKLRNLLTDANEAELFQGGKAIYNHAFNPSADPSTGSLEELQFINDQNTTNYKKSKLEGYGLALDLLKTDVTSDFLAKFDKCFSKFIDGRPVVYITDPEAEEEEDE